MQSMKPTSAPLITKAIVILFFLQSNGISAQSQKTGNEEHEVKEALRLETQYFYQRDLEKWEGQWSHKPFVMKCYIRDGKYSEQLGWPVIQKSAEDYMKEHPEPEKPPTDIPDYEIEVFDKSAFVTYVIQDPTRGKKKEIRMMVKENGKWKIGYMSTNYYTE